MMDEKFYLIIDSNLISFLSFQFDRMPPFQTWSIVKAEELLKFKTDKSLDLHQLKMQISCPFSPSKENVLLVS
jgi:homoaconitase/3-isopropylmalate dehydratase large subunit